MKLVLGPIIGGVTHNKAKVWIFWNQSHPNEPDPQCLIFKDEMCKVKISESPFPFKRVSSSIHRSGVIHAIAGLATIIFKRREKFYFKIEFDSPDEPENDLVYSIQPFPEIGTDIDELSFSLISCHHPSFDPKKDANIVAPMWRRLNDEMHSNDCSFLIQAGDQVYSDHDQFNAWKWSMKNDSDEKMLWYYRQIYLKSWNFPEVQEVFRTFPQYMIWDDHEITNGWGSRKKHSKNSRCREVFEVARQAYIEFQNCHNPAPLHKGEFYFAFHYASIAFLFMDLRGHRDITRNTLPLAGKKQWEDITTWLNSESVQQSKLLFVVSSVPVCHLSRRFGSLGIFKNDIRDQWSTSHNKDERRLLLDLLFDWSGDEKKPVIILSGDVHVGTVAKIMEKETGKYIHQITSSPITNKPARFIDLLIAIFSSRFKFSLDKNNKRPVHGQIIRRYRKRNFAVIKVQFNNQNPRVDLNMYEEGKSNPDNVQICK